MFQQSPKDVHRVTQGARNHDIADPRILIRGEVVVSDTALRTEVFPVETRIDGSNQRDEAHAIGRDNIPAAPLLACG